MTCVQPRFERSDDYARDVRGCQFFQVSRIYFCAPLSRQNQIRATISGVRRVVDFNPSGGSEGIVCFRESETFEGLSIALIRVARFDGLASPEANILYRKSVNVFSRDRAIGWGDSCEVKG